MADWNTYRMWRRVKTIISNHDNSAEILGDWKATEITFRARSQPEAQRKADKFWRDAQLGTGSMVCVLEGSTMTRSTTSEQPVARDKALSTEQHGFAITPPILRGHGPQMEDYANFDEWLFARRLYTLEKMGATVSPRMKEHAEATRIKRP